MNPSAFGRSRKTCSSASPAKRPYIAAVIAPRNRAGRDLDNVFTLYPGKLPVLDDGIHFNAEGQIMAGKFTASAVEAFYQTKAAQKGSSIPREKE